MQAMNTILSGAAIGAEFPLLSKIAQSIPMPAIKEIFTIYGDALNQSIQAVKNNPAQGGIFADIRRNAKSNENLLTDLEMGAEAAGFTLTAPTETVHSLTYLIWAVLQRPELRTALEEEVQTLKEGFADVNVEELPLLNAIIEESLRLYGPCPGCLPRVVPHGGATLGGFFLPEGVIVSSQTYTVHRDPDLFPNPDRYVIFFFAWFHLLCW